MYKTTVPYKNYAGKPRNKELAFHLEIRDVIKLMVPLNKIFSWRDSLLNEEGERILESEEVVDFFDAFEGVILASYGEITDDGEGFSRANRYVFEESKAFAAFMEVFLSDIGEVNNFLKGIIPEGMEELVRKQAASLERMEQDGATDEDLRKEVARLRAQLPQSGGSDEQSS